MRLGPLLQPGDVVCLVGELGSGKTTFMQGVASGWGSLDPVSSPTFVLVNVYRRPEEQRLFHLDAYRLGSVAEAVDLDIDSMLVAGPMIVEWADRIEPALPANNLWVTMQWVDDYQRDLMFTAHGVRYQEMLAGFRKLVYGG